VESRMWGLLVTNRGIVWRRNLAQDENGGEGDCSSLYDRGDRRTIGGLAVSVRTFS